jgi:hypothetical protein
MELRYRGIRYQSGDNDHDAPVVKPEQLPRHAGASSSSGRRVSPPIELIYRGVRYMRP